MQYPHTIPISSVIVGFIIGVMLLFGLRKDIRTGQFGLRFYKSEAHYRRDTQPVLFWMNVGVIAFLGAVFCLGFGLLFILWLSQK